MKARLFSVATLAGGIAAAAYVGMSAAHADQYIYTLQDGTADFGTQLSTTPFSNINAGESYIAALNTTTGAFTDDYSIYGKGNEVLNPFTNDVIAWNLTVYNSGDPAADLGVPDGSAIYFMDFGSGYANQFVDAVSTTAGELNTITDTLITPFGDFTLFTF